MSIDIHADAPVDGTGGFVGAWLAPGDDLRSGGQVPAGRYGLRVHGVDTELLGDPAELGEFGDRIAARWVSRRTDAVNEVADRIGLHVEQRGGLSQLGNVLGCGDVDAFARMLALFGHNEEADNLVIAHTMSGVGGCDSEDHAPMQVLGDAAEVLAGAVTDRIVRPDYTEADAAVHAYVGSLLPDTDAARERVARKAQFLDVAADTRRLEAEAEQLCDEANEDGGENDEFQKREEAAESASLALALAEELLG